MSLSGFHNHKYFTQFLFYGAIGPIFVLATTIPYIISYFNVRLVYLMALLTPSFINVFFFDLPLYSSQLRPFACASRVQPNTANSVFSLSVSSAAGGESSFYPVPFRPIVLMVMAVLVMSCCLSCLMMFATVLPGILTNKTAVEDAQVRSRRRAHLHFQSDIVYFTSVNALIDLFYI